MSAGRVTLHQFAELEAARLARNGKGFTLLRLAPPGWAALDEEIVTLVSLVGASLRRTDFVQRVRECEVGVVLVDTMDEQVAVPVQRISKAAAEHLPKMELLIGWASVGPGQRQTWQEAWRWAGELLVAEAAIPAAA